MNSIPQLPLRQLDGGLHVPPDGGGQTVIEQVEGRQPADLGVPERLGGLLEDLEHRALAHRPELPGERIVLRELDDGLLEEIELVRVERIERTEGVAPAPAGQLDRAVAEAEEGLEVGALTVVDGGEDLRLLFLLGEQPFLDHVAHVGAGQRDRGLEAPLDLADVLRLEVLEIAEA